MFLQYQKSVRRAQMRSHRAKSLTCRSFTQHTDLRGVLSPPAVLHRKSHNRPMRMTAEFLSWRYRHVFQVIYTQLQSLIINHVWLFKLFTHDIMTLFCSSSQYSRCLALGKPLQFSQKDIPKIRKRIYKELCECKVHEQGWPVRYSCSACD